MSKVVEAFCDKAGRCFCHNLLGALGLDGVCESKAFGDKVVISTRYKLVTYSYLHFRRL